MTRYVAADQRLAACAGLLAAMAALVLLLVLTFVLREALPMFGEPALHLLSNEGWYPLEGRVGALPMLAAAVAVALGALLIAAPIGVAGAVFERFHAPAPLAKLYRAVLSVLAGVPSVAYGLWGLTVLVPLIGRWHPPGASLLAAALVLALMILPTVAVTASAALAAVPHSLLRGAAMLGISPTGAVLGVELPAARPAIQAGVLLALARALGVTMAVLMVAGNVVQMPTSVFDPVRVLTANMALEMAYATGLHRAALFATGVLTLGLALGVSLLAARGLRGTRSLPAGALRA